MYPGLEYAKDVIVGELTEMLLVVLIICIGFVELWHIIDDREYRWELCHADMQ